MDNNIFLVVIALIISVGGMIYFADKQQRMLHNVDLVFNAVKDEQKLFNGFDEYAPGKTISLLDLWHIGLSNVRTIYLYFGIFAFAFGITLNELIHMREDERE